MLKKIKKKTTAKRKEEGKEGRKTERETQQVKSMKPKLFVVVVPIDKIDRFLVRATHLQRMQISVGNENVNIITDLWNTKRIIEYFEQLYSISLVT